MGSQGFIGKTKLAEIFKAARFHNTHTMQALKLGEHFLDIGGDPYTPVEVMIASADNEPLGSAWIAEIDELFILAEQEGDTSQTNPNIPQLVNIYRHMIEMRRDLGQPYEPKSDTAKSLGAPVTEEDRKRVLSQNRTPYTAQIIHFAPPSR